MKKRLILILTLGLSLTGCLGKKAAPEEKKTPPPPKIKESVESFESVEEKPKEKEVVKNPIPTKIYTMRLRERSFILILMLLTTVLYISTEMDTLMDPMFREMEVTLIFHSLMGNLI